MAMKAIRPDIEVRVRMLNVNLGSNQKLLEACQTLKEYSWLVEQIRINKSKVNSDLEEAVNNALTDMPNEFVIKPFLMAHQAEVKGMLLTEYNEVEQMGLFKEDGRREGRAEGRAEGTLQTLIELVKDGILTIKDAAVRAKMSEDAFSAKMKSL